MLSNHSFNYDVHYEEFLIIKRQQKLIHKKKYFEKTLK